MSKNISQDDKKRNIMISMGVMTILAICIGAYFMTRTNTNNKPISPNIATNSTPNTPSTPGNSTSIAYNLDVKAENEKNAQQALKEGRSFEPRIVNNDLLASGSPIDSLQQGARKVQAEPEPVIKPVEIVVPEPDRVAVPVVTQQPTVVSATPVQQPTATRVAAPRYSADQMNILASLSGAYRNRGTAIETDYTQSKQQVPNVGNVGNVGNIGNTTTNTANSTDNSAVLMKAGDMINAVLETEINSDEPSPVLARIVGGKMNGGKAVCSIQRNGEKALVECKKLNLPSMPKSISVNLVAIDPTTTRTGLATDVDRHYFQKYVVGLGATFLKGYADALLRQNSTTSVNPFGGVTVVTGQLDAKDISKQGLGEVGRSIAEETRQSAINLKPTVHVKAGTAIGLMATDDILVR